MNVPFLGRIPLDPRIGRACDEGKSYLDEIADSPAVKAYNSIIAQIKAYCEANPAIVH